MTRYLDLSSDSGVTDYEIGSDFIAVWFRDRAEPYRYTVERIGRQHVEHMKMLAMTGRGLSTYISQNDAVKNGYVR